ncbi:hypothetical protein OXX79_008732 [Metschnikowia pulcherrima]
MNSSIQTIWIFLLYTLSVQCLGSLYVSIKGSSKRHAIGIGSTNAFLYDRDGSMQLLDTGGYLVFMGNGKLASSSSPQFGFVLTLTADCNKEYKVSYKGNSRFYLCENRDISIFNGCPGAQEASISFDGGV